MAQETLQGKPRILPPAEIILACALSHILAVALILLFGAYFLGGIVVPAFYLVFLGYICRRQLHTYKHCVQAKPLQYRVTQIWALTVGLTPSYLAVAYAVCVSWDGLLPLTCSLLLPTQLACAFIGYLRYLCEESGTTATVKTRDSRVQQSVVWRYAMRRMLGAHYHPRGHFPPFLSTVKPEIAVFSSSLYGAALCWACLGLAFVTAGTRQREAVTLSSALANTLKT